MFTEVSDWITQNLAFFGLPAVFWIVVITVTAAAVSVGVCAKAIIYIPNDYFLGPHRPRTVREQHPVLSWLVVIGKNLLGWILIFLGVVQLFVPGQGLLTMLLGIMLVDFPGKRRLEQRFIGWPRVRRAVDALRVKFGREPLQLDDDNPKSVS